MISGMWKNVICVGTGNEGNTGGHISGKLGQQEERILEFGISQQEPVMNIQLWKAYFDQVNYGNTNLYLKDLTMLISKKN